MNHQPFEEWLLSDESLTPEEDRALQADLDAELLVVVQRHLRHEHLDHDLRRHDVQLLDQRHQLGEVLRRRADELQHVCLPETTERSAMCDVIRHVVGQLNVRQAKRCSDFRD